MVKKVKVSGLLSKMGWFLPPLPAPAEFVDVEPWVESWLGVDHQAHAFLEAATAAGGSSSPQEKHGWKRGSKSTIKD